MYELVVLPANQCIINRLCRDLAALDRTVLARSAVILPTRRLVTFCLAALAERHTAYEPPLLTTLDGFVARLQGTERPTVTELQVEQMLQMQLTHGDYEHLHPAFAHELRQLDDDVIAADLHLHFHARIEQQLAQNPWLAEGEIVRQRHKYAAVQRLFVALHAQLQDDGQMTRSVARRQALRTAVVSEGDFDHLYVAAFTSVSKTVDVFLQKLAVLPHVTFYFNHITTTNPSNPATELLTSVARSAGRTVPQPPPVPETHVEATIGILHFASPQVEITYALHRAQQLLQAGGVRPAEIAIVLSSDAFYLPHLLAVADFFSFAKNIAVPIPLRMTSVGGFLQALSNYACSEFQVPAALDLVAHPLAAVADSQRDDIILALSAIHCRGPGKLRLLLGVDTPAGKAIARFERIVQRFRTASWRTQLLCLRGLLHELGFVAQATRENFEQRSIAQVEEFLCSLAASGMSATTKCVPAEFWQFVREKLLVFPLRKIGEPLAGVQILSLPEVRAMPFQHVLVVGCHEGFFPKSLPRDVIVSDKLKTAIGLSGWQHLEAMEDVTFHGLCGRRLHLTCSYCSSTAERSRFIEKIVRTHHLKEQDCTGLTLPDLLPASSVCTVPLDAVPVTTRRDFFATVSASSAENFVRCPLRHFLSRLSIVGCEVREQDTPQEEGNRLHRVIEKFSSDPVYRRICRDTQEDSVRVAQLCELLNDITATHASSLLNDRALATHLRLFAWPRLAEFVSRKTRSASYREWNEYELRLPAALSWSEGRRAELHCKVDHIHEDDEHVLLLDYKRKRLPENRELDAGIALQLAFYAYALACARRADEGAGLAKMVTGYYSILNGELMLVAHGEDITASFLRARFNVTERKTRRLEELVEKMHDLLAFRSRVGDIYSTIDPSFCSGCQFEDVCRKNDPALREQIAAQNFLQVYGQGQ